MTGLRLGVADHLGWAVTVTAAADHRVVDRRRIELVEPGLSAAPIHYDRGQSSDAVVGDLVAQVRASVARLASTAFATLPGPITSISLRTWPADFPTDLAVLRKAPWEARADAVMYRQVLAEVGEANGWTVHLYDARGVEAQARHLLGAQADDVLTGARARLGPPWTKDHRQALAATVLAALG